jgi:acyl-CoA reductase-like NAD-dependent aldehyde dehydrogenase
VEITTLDTLQLGFGRPALSAEPTAPQDGVSAARERLMAMPPAQRAALLRQTADALEQAARQDAGTVEARALPASAAV